MAGISLRHIEVFHAVYTHGSVSAAARALHVSQPAVSKTLQHAESILGFPLFERQAGSLVATADAHALFADVHAIQERVAALREGAQNLRLGDGALLRIAALPSLALGVLPRAVARFLAVRPAVHFDLQTAHHGDLARKLHDREFDLAIAAEVPKSAPIGSHLLGRGELVALFRERDLPDAGERLPLSALRGQRFISVGQSGPLGEILTHAREQLQVDLDDSISARTFYIATALVQAGVGVAVVDCFTAATALAPGLVMRPLQPALPFDLHAMYLRDRPPPAVAMDFLKMVSAELNGLPA